MKNIKILHIVNVPFVLPYFLGDQINFLKSHGCEVTIACSPSSKLDDFTAKYNIEKFEVNVTRSINPFTDLKTVFKLYKFIKKQKFDYVIGHTPKGALVGMLSSYFAQTKNRIYFRHGLVFETSRGWKLKLLVSLEKLTSFLATNIVSVSKSVLDYSIENGFGSFEKNIILNQGTCNGVDTIKFSKDLNNRGLKRELGISDDNIVIGYVGRLVNDKGIVELVGAWKLLLSKYNNITLLLVGPFEERDSLSFQVKDFLNTSSSVVVTGLVDNSVDYYNIMDIFVLPSYREGFPTVVLEASSMELPVITTRSTGCVNSIIEGKTGIFTDICGTDICEKIDYYINNSETRSSHGKDGRLWIQENFRQEVVWDEIGKNIYRL